MTWIVIIRCDLVVAKYSWLQAINTLYFSELNRIDVFRHRGCEKVDKRGFHWQYFKTVNHVCQALSGFLSDEAFELIKIWRGPSSDVYLTLVDIAEDVVFYSRLDLHRHNCFGKCSCNVLDHHKTATSCQSKLVCSLPCTGWFVRWIDVFSAPFHFKLLPGGYIYRSHWTMVQNQPYFSLFLVNQPMRLDSR